VNLTAMQSTTYVFTTVVVILVMWLKKRISARKRFQGIPRIGIDPGFLGLRLSASKAQFFAHGQKLLEKGYAEVSIVFNI
jgi:hypothetical protein